MKARVSTVQYIVNKQGGKAFNIKISFRVTIALELLSVDTVLYISIIMRYG